MSFSLIKLLSIETNFVKWIGLLPFKLTRDKQWFIYSSHLFYKQLIGMIPLSFAFLWYQTDDCLVPYKISLQSESAAIMASTIYNWILICDAYCSVSMLIHRLYLRHGFGKTYNDLLVIDRKILKLNQNSSYVDYVKKAYCQRLIFLSLIRAGETYNNIIEFNFSKPCSAAAIFGLRIYTDFLFCQMLNVFQVLYAQAIEIERNIQQSESKVDIKQNYEVFLDIFNVIKRANSVYGLQVFINTFTGLIFVVFYLFDIITTVEKQGLSVLLSHLALKWLVSVVLCLAYEFSLIYELSKLKDKVQNVLIKFQLAEERLKIPSNPYYMICLWLDEKVYTIFQNYWLPNDRRTIFQVGSNIFKVYF